MMHVPFDQRAANHVPPQASGRKESRDCAPGTRAGMPMTAEERMQGEAATHSRVLVPSAASGIRAFQWRPCCPAAPDDGGRPPAAVSAEARGSCP